MQAAGSRLQQQAAWHTTDSSSASSSSSSSSSSSDSQQQAPGAADPFTRSLQSKTEQEVFSLLEKAKQQQQQQQEDEEEDDDLISVVNPETGEAYGPRGKEPTRYGDWEVKGRATDFA
uniref:Succinate dehydrogenase assembly factor 4, mitochondrial n=1 Tax=Tetradesmus obliquus TaxID=3088 RepID=A0A383VAN8_TETOB|eukprot:jgi/Sobl393_1/13268/SZX62645.1